MLVLEYTDNDNHPQHVGLEFEYFRVVGEDEPEVAPVDVVWKPTGVTAAITDIRDNTPIAIGESRLHPNDAFDKRIGRKMAFERAVDVFTYDKAIKQQLWKSFMAQVKV